MKFWPIIEIKLCLTQSIGKVLNIKYVLCPTEVEIHQVLCVYLDWKAKKFCYLTFTLFHVNILSMYVYGKTMLLKWVFDTSFQSCFRSWYLDAEYWSVYTPFKFPLNAFCFGKFGQQHLFSFRSCPIHMMVLLNWWLSKYMQWTLKDMFKIHKHCFSLYTEYSIPTMETKQMKQMFD